MPDNRTTEDECGCGLWVCPICRPAPAPDLPRAQRQAILCEQIRRWEARWLPAALCND